MVRGRKSIFERRKHTVLSGAAVILAASVGLVLLFLFVNSVYTGNPGVSEQTGNGTYDRGFTAAAANDRRPFSYTGRDGSLQGYDAELLNELSDKLSQNASLELSDPETALHALNGGQVDVLLGYEADGTEEEKGIILTVPTGSLTYVIYGRSKGADEGDLYNSSVAAMRGFPGLSLEQELSVVGSCKEILEGIAQGRFDYGICPVETGMYVLDEYGIKGVYPGCEISRKWLYAALGTKNVDLRNRLNIALKTLYKEGRLEELGRKWIRYRYESMGLTGVFAAFPWIAVLVLFAAGFAAFTGYLHFDERKRAGYNERLTERLYHNLQAVDRENLTVESERALMLKEKKQAISSNAAKTRFLSRLSEELAGPVNSITENAELAVSNFEDPDVSADYLERAVRGCRSLKALLSNILEAARIESGSVRIDNKPEDLYSILDSVDAVVSDEAERKNIRLLIRSGEMKDSRVLCDRLRLIQVLINLADNAIRFTPERGEVRMTLNQLESTRRGYGLYEFRVKDSGPGIEPEIAGKMFEAFVKGKQPDTEKVRRTRAGAGLGLSVAKGLTAAMGGDLSAEASKRGAEFVMTLTLRLQNEETDPRAEAQIKKRRETESSFEGVSVLLAGADERGISETEKLIGSLGATVFRAENGEKAIEMVIASSAAPYDIIFTDTALGDFDGYELAQRIRGMSDAGLSTIPVVLLTADILEDDREKAFEAGVNGHLSLPVEKELLIRTLRAFLIQVRAIA
ncbi:MAG TPA: hypothetical protein DCL38_10585 [Lachnospiraceae bacterium]|nr:hypothetical protein [Lachnospiraceae bacterium]